MRIWLFVRSYMMGVIGGSALISHFTYKQVQTADWEIQYGLEDLAALELDIANRGKERLIQTIEAPVEHILKVFRTFLPNNVAALAGKEPLAVTVPQVLNPLMRELVDDSESRRRLAAAPAFPCKLRKRSISTNNNTTTSVENETNVTLWSAVLPWETSLGLSHVKLNSYYNNNKKNISASSSSSTSLVEDQEQQQQDINAIQNIPRGMLFVSRGIEEATSDLNGAFVKWVPHQSFWSGAIRQRIDVLFLQSKKPIPKNVTYARRGEGELAEVLLDPFRNGYGCRVQDVQQLDPFDRWKTNSNDDAEGKSTEKKKSLPQHVYDMMFDNNNNNDVSSSGSYSVLCPKSANAPFFVLELPGGFTEEKIIRSTTSKNSSVDASYVELELGEEICKDIDTKMMVARHFVPVLKSATNEVLKRMCTEVLQKGARYVMEERESQRKNDEMKLGFGKDNNNKSSSPDEASGVDIMHEWSNEDTEFLCMATRLSVSDFELLGTTWDVLKDYIIRYDAKIINNQQQQQVDDDDAEELKLFFDERRESFDHIWKLMHDGSVCLPDSIMRLMIQEQSRMEEAKFKL